MPYNRYQGNSGNVTRVEAGHEAPFQRPVKAPPPTERRPPSPLSGLSGELGKLLHKLGSLELESEDLILIMILYLLYKESRDEEYLLMIGGLLFL